MNLLAETVFLKEGWPKLEGHVVGSITTCKIFQAILDKTRAESIFEIGFNYGHSAFIFQTLNPELKYHSIDIGKYKHTHANMEKFTELFKNFTGTIRNSQGIEAEEVSKYDMVFIDGDHSNGGLSKDLNLCNAAGVKYILVDDYVRCIAPGCFPRAVVDHYIENKAEFPYSLLSTFVYECSNGTNYMVLLERNDI